jgi:hypothetical protein
LQVAAAKLEEIAQLFEFKQDNFEKLVQTCMTTLSSKMCGPAPPLRPCPSLQRRVVQTRCRLLGASNHSLAPVGTRSLTRQMR